MLTDINLIHARAAIQIDVEEGHTFEHAIETAEIVYELSDKEIKQVIESIETSLWYLDYKQGRNYVRY